MRLFSFKERTMKKKTKKIILIAAAILLVLLIAALLIVPRQLAMAVYRDNFGKRYASYEPLTWTMEDFDTLQREKHLFPSDQGQMLTGYRYSQPDRDARGLIVLVHGMGGGHRFYLNVIDYFTKAGYDVFAYDATGNDESEGEAMGGLPQGLIDLDYALRYIKASPAFEGLPLMLWGHSWGGYACGTVTKLHPDVKAAVIVAGFNASVDMLESEGRNIAGNAIDFVLPHFEQYEQETFGDYAAMSVMDSLEATDVPAMFIHSADDEMIPIEISFDRYYEKFSNNDRFTFIRYEDRGHSYIFLSPDRSTYIDAYNADANAYEEAMGKLTPEMVAAYHENHFDMHKGYPVDAELMQQMLALYDSCALSPTP